MAYKRGDFIGPKYEVYGVIGAGGFGVVYLVYSRETKEAFALKTFRDEYLADATTRERFRKEAMVWVDLERHPYLVRAYFVEELGGRLYIAMEHIAPDEQGLNSLDGYLERRPPDLAQSLRWSIQFCHGMEHAYSKGIRSHRDIKPANIMISQDRTVKISDFGLAGVLAASKAVSGIKLNLQQGRVGLSGQTMEGTGIGTPTHMPPEQFTNAAGCDERSDIYSFGIVLYQMATGGNLPFLASLPRDGSEEEARRFWMAMYRLHSESPVPKPSTPLFPIIQRCLEKEAGRRYQTFEQLRKDLEPLLKRQTGEIIKPVELSQLEAWERSNKGASLASLACFDDAIRWLNEAIELDPLLPHAWANKGICLEELKRFSSAVACYDKALQLDPRNASIHNNKGNSLNHMGRFEEAISCIDMALEIQPENAGYWSNKGKNLNQLGRTNEALRCIDKALAIDSRLSFAWHNKGLCLMNKGLSDEALACFKKTIEIDPWHVAAWHNKAIAELALGRKREAMHSFRQFIVVAPKDDIEEIQQARKWLEELERGSFREQKSPGTLEEASAIKAAKDVLAVAEKSHAGKRPHVVALNNLASVYAAEGGYAEAEALYKQALALIESAMGPDYSEVSAYLNNLAMLYHTQGRYSEAQRLYERAVTIVENAYGQDDLNLGAFLTNLAAAYDAQGMHDKAQHLYKRALAIKESALGPDDPSVAVTLEQYAASLREIGMVEEARVMEARAKEIRLIRQDVQ
jgi:tetratricopeptide (TPR) repeat protein